MNKVAILLLVIMLVLLTIGVIMLFSTSAAYAKERYGDPHYLLKRQALWLVLGAVGCGMVAGMPYPKWRAACVPLLVVAFALLALVLVPGIGARVGGARRWLNLGLMRFQPSEFAKLALVIWLAHWLAREQRRVGQFQRGFVIPMAVTGTMLLLVLAEPDFGSTALLAAVVFGLMFLAGVRVRYLLPTILAGLAAFAVLILHNPTRAARMLAFVDLEKYKQGPGYQVWQGVLALGSGGFSGLGLGNSRQKMWFLPEAHTDFILPIIGEELGLVGTLGILLVFALLVACGLVISLKAVDPFGRYLGFGATLLLGLQVLINVGVVTACLPAKGLPLPFISFGGSNLVMNMVAVGLLLSIYRHGTVPEQSEEREFFARRSPVTG